MAVTSSTHAAGMTVKSFNEENSTDPFANSSNRYRSTMAETPVNESSLVFFGILAFAWVSASFYLVYGGRPIIPNYEKNQQKQK